MRGACNYSLPQRTLRLTDPGLPCSKIYTTTLSLNGLTNRITVEIVEDPTDSTTIPSFACFKLKLKRICRQKWFLPNEYTREIEVMDLTTDYCNRGFLKCEVALQYPDYEF